VDPLPQDFIRSFLISENGGRGEAPGFRKPGDAPSADDIYPLMIQPREGAPAPGELKGNENSDRAVVSMFYTGGVETGPYNKFRRKEVFDFWMRTRDPQDAKLIDDRIRVLLHDKRGWNMDGLEVIESLRWRPMQPVGSGPNGYSYTSGYIFELYADSGN
jgi:hypothetical protein